MSTMRVFYVSKLRNPNRESSLNCSIDKVNNNKAVFGSM